MPLLNTHDIMSEIAKDFHDMRKLGPNSHLNTILATKLYNIGYDWGLSADWLAQDIKNNASTLAEEFNMSADRIKWCALQIEKGIISTMRFLD